VELLELAASPSHGKMASWCNGAGWEMAMEPVVYVVTLVGDDIANPHKYFTDRQAAQQYALTFEEDPAIEYVDTYRVSGHAGASAIEARMRGEGELIERQPSVPEQRRRIDRAGGLAQYLGLVRPQAPIKRRD
jgi:hypothetical protein